MRFISESQKRRGELISIIIILFFCLIWLNHEQKFSGSKYLNQRTFLSDRENRGDTCKGLFTRYDDESDMFTATNVLYETQCHCCIM